MSYGLARRISIVVSAFLFSFLLFSASGGTAVAEVQQSGGFLSYFAVGGVATNAARYDVVILNEWNSDQIAAIKTGNPLAKVLLYKDSAFLRASDSPSTVQGFGEVSLNHPDWFLLDAQGNRISMDYFGNGDMWYHMDWANLGWQQYYAGRAIATAKALGFDGIFADDLFVTRKAALSNYPVQYPSDAALQSAVHSFLSATYSSTKRAGLLLMGNVSFDQLYVPGLWAEWLSVSDGLMQENFVSAEGGAQTIEGMWKQQVDSVATAEALGKVSLNVSQGVSGDRDSMIYSYASYLLAAGHAGLYYHALDGDYDLPATWDALWSRDLGTATAAYVAGGDGVYSRVFQNGKVFVNPSKTLTRTIAVTGFVNEAGASVSSLTLKPSRGAILFAAPATTTTTVVPTATTTTVAPTTTTTTVRTAIVTAQMIISSPASGSVVQGKVAVGANVTSAKAVGKMRLYVDGRLIATDYRAPYTFTWNATRLAPGSTHTIAGKAYNTSGAEMAAATITVKIAGSTNTKSLLAAASTTPTITDASLFPDLTLSSQYGEAVLALAEAGVVSGFADGTFGANNSVTRAQFAKMVAGTLGIADGASTWTPFLDLDPADVDLYPQKYIAALFSLGAVEGTTSDQFSPWDSVSRAQFISIAVRALRTLAPGALTEPPADFVSAMGSFSPSHEASMSIAEYNGLLDGLSEYGSAWDPWAPATRGEVAQVLYNLTILE